MPGISAQEVMLKVQEAAPEMMLEAQEAAEEMMLELQEANPPQASSTAW